MMCEKFLTEEYEVLHLTNENDEFIGSLKINRFDVVVNGDDVALPHHWSSMIAPPTPLIPLLIKLTYIIRQPSRHGKVRVTTAMVLLHNLVDYIAESVGVQRANKTIFEKTDLVPQ